MSCIRFGRALALGLLTSTSALAFAPLALAADTTATAASDTTVDTVVVTANRREENAQIVPVAVTSVSGRTIEASGYQSLTDLQYLVPGVQYDPTQGSAFQIRGVGSESFDFSNEKSVSVVVDDVVMDAQRDNGLTGLTDLKGVDVLMGPQGTLFGKGATSGVINVTTNNPVLGQWSGTANLSYGERSDRTDNVTLNVPLTDRLAFRVSGFDQGQDGFGEYTTLQQKLGKVDEYGYRAKLLIAPSDRLEIVLANDYEHHWDNSIRTPVTAFSPVYVGAANAAIYDADEIADGVNVGPKNANTADSHQGSITIGEWGDSIRIKAKIGNDTLTSITAYRGTTYNNNTPVDVLPDTQYDLVPYNDGNLVTSKVSEELRWASPTGQFFEYLGGLFYNRLNADQTQLQWFYHYYSGAPLIAGGATGTTFVSTTTPAGSTGNEVRFDAHNTSYAAFGQIKLNFTDQLNLALGGRYSEDVNSQAISYPTINTASVNGLADTIIGSLANPYQNQGSVTSKNFSYRIAPEYRINKDIMVYASYTTGYKPAGVAFVSSKYDPYRAETVASYEVGEKSEFFNHRVRFDLDVFDEQFTNFQATILTYIPGYPTAQSVIGNAQGLKSEGVETTFAVRATDALTLSGSATYSDAYFTNYIANPTTNYTGTALSNAPRWSAFASANYVHDFVQGLTMQANVEYAYRSSIWTTTGEPSWAQVPGYGLVNARITLSPSAKPMQFGIYGRNLFNTYFSTGYQSYLGVGYLHYTSPDAYRTLGLFARYSF